MKKKQIILSTTILLIITIVLFAFDTRLKTVEYIIDSPKITSEIRIVLITDLHSCYYGDNQQDLIETIDLQKPDAVLLGGDIFDDVLDQKNSRIFVSEISQKYPTYYVSGNHEWWSNKMYDIFDCIKDSGAEVLRGNSAKLEINSQVISICGIDDPEVDRCDPTFANWEEQLKNSSENTDTESFNILLAHHPEKAEKYFEYNFDLALSGHAHGGQFRIPLIMNGFYAPDQGYFPKLAGGLYNFDGKTLIISRGLAKENTRLPRIFNRPEVVVVTLR